MLFLLLLAGAAAGFIAGLVGVGGGIIFGPVLFFVFQAIGLEDPVLTPLTLGSGLLCTGVSAASGALVQLRAGAVDRPTALMAGVASALTVILVTTFVTTQPWYDKRAYAVVLGAVLLLVVSRMLFGRDALGGSISLEGARRSPVRAGGIGALAGAVSAAAGVGGGVVLVPAFNALMRLPLKAAAATSTVAIVLVSLVGVAIYAVRGLGADGLPPGAVGYVYVPYALVLAAPALVTARLGVKTAHRVDVRYVRYSFAALATVVSLQLLWDVFGV